MEEQKPQDKLCWLCDGRLTSSREHLFPHAIGGKKAIRGFICNRCNNVSGSKWDKQLLELLIFNRLEHGVESITAALDAVSEDSIDGHKRFNVFGFQDVRVADTASEVLERPDGSIDVSISAGNLRALKKALDGIKRKYPQLETVDPTNWVRQNSESGVVELKSKVIFTVPDVEKSVIKTAMCWAFATGSDPRKCELAYHYMRGIPVFGSRQEFGLIELKSPVEPLIAKNYHTVAIRRDGQRGSIVAQVDYYGSFQFFLPLSFQYKGETMLHIHSVNVKTGDVLEYTRTPIRESFEGPWSAITDKTTSG